MPLEDGPLGISPVREAVNDASTRVAIVWLTFLTFTIYLAITLGTVTHRMLFLGSSISLPVLKVDLPLHGFFAVAPLLSLVFHFYLLVQLIVLKQKIISFEDVLRRTTGVTADRILLRQGLNAFPITQLMAGPGRERSSGATAMLFCVVSITLFFAPLIVLLQVLFVFLPYHDPVITWLHRSAIVLDMAIVWGLWLVIRQQKSSELASERRERNIIRLVASFAPATLLSVFVLFIVLAVAVFPGEAIYHNKLQHFLSSRLLIGREVDEVAGRPRSLFSNVLVLPGETFVEEEKIRQQQRSVSLRGRDLRGAILMRSDLRKADFSGANLNEANLYKSSLQGAWLSCIETSSAGYQSGRGVVFDLREPPYLEWPRDGCTWLQGANLQEAELQGTSLQGAKLQGTNLALAKLQGASLKAAWLDASALFGTELEGALLEGARLQGAALRVSSSVSLAAEFNVPVMCRVGFYS